MDNFSGSMKLFSLDRPDLSEEIVRRAFDAGINFFDVASDQSIQEE